MYLCDEISKLSKSSLSGQVNNEIHLIFFLKIEFSNCLLYFRRKIRNELKMAGLVLLLAMNGTVTQQNGGKSVKNELTIGKHLLKGECS